MTMRTRDAFAGIKATLAVSTGASFTSESEQDLAYIPLDSLSGEQSIAMVVSGLLTAGSPAGTGVITVSANWQEADDGSSTNVQDVPGHEVIAAVTVATVSGNRRFYAVLPLNLEMVSKAFVRAQVTVGANAADTHASSVMYLIGGSQKVPTSRVAAAVI